MSKYQTKFTNTFDELIKNRYGKPSRRGLRDLDQVEDLIANYYGKPAALKSRRRKRQTPFVVALSYDNGETLPQIISEKYQAEDIEQSPPEETAFQEYVVEGAGPTPEDTGSEQGPVSPADEPGVTEEYQVDILQPLEDRPAPEAERAPNGERAPKAELTPKASPPEKPTQPIEMEKPGQAVAYPAAPPIEADSQQKPVVDEDEFLADMQSILNGQKVYDPMSKKIVEKDKLGQAQSQASRSPGSALPAPDAANSQAIFDRIAESMAYANAYDLGTVELENRFSNFDKAFDRQQKMASKKKTQPQPQPAAPAPTVSSADFIEDLDAIHHQRSEAGLPGGAAAYQDYSRPFYDTGEHVLAGKDLYQDRLRVGQNPGLPFSYGQIIAMADLFETVDEMMGASVSDLQRIKALIERSTEYYKSNKSGAVRDVTSEEWEQATQERYLRLAEDNYEHFSPNTLFKDSALARSANRFGNNQTAWEQHHKRAIEEAQKLFLDPQNANQTIFPEWPLIINAFGDHFLTDAFASGHMINKEVMIALFKSKFYNGSSLKPEGEKFFEKVAAKAFKGEVARRFSGLETVDYPVCAWGWCFKWRPNINSKDRFKQVLTGAAEQQPDRIANLAVKALHDRLNTEGIEVTNQAGDGKWKLTGDSTLDAKNLAIMHKAVQQSVDNINDPSIRASNLNFQTYFSKVWKFVPQFTEASRRQAERLMNDYSRPDSDLLVTAAAEIIHKELDSLIKALLRENKLKPA